jgi:glycosyltransferase involved in cell wall biosynthesis
MRIALLSPTYWPEVRRGSERIVHDLGTTLAERGHDVTLLTSHPAKTQIRVEDGMRVIRSRRLAQPPPARWYEYYLTTVPSATRGLLEADFDIAHAFFPASALAAALARRLGGPRFVFSIHGIPTREYLVARRYRMELLRTTIDAASAVSVLSEAAAVPTRRYLLCRPLVIPGGVVREQYALDLPRASEPTLVCAASLADPRKRAPLLLAAFRRLRERVPAARLLLVGGADMPDLGNEDLELPDGVARLELNRSDDLARCYASAWASVLPSIEEAFGLVLIESLAAGTPVVAANSGACPEIVNGEAIGRLFGADDEAEMSAAMLEALELARDPGTAAACRKRAAEFDWHRIADRFEELYLSIWGQRA